MMPAAMASLSSPVPNPNSHVALTRNLAVACLLGLIAWGLAWELWLSPLRPSGSWWAIKVLPLCLPLAGVLKNRMYTYRWLSLLVWLYFAEGIVRATSERGAGVWLGWGQTLLCVGLFVACAMHVRLRLKAAKEAAKEAAKDATSAAASDDAKPA
jgi:uncharacterized membrane protein